MHLNRRRSLPISSIHTRSRNHRRIPSLEGLEERVVLSPTVYMVDSTADGAGSGTLRDAITKANANPNSAGSTIEFSNTVFSTPQTIRLTGGTLDLTESAGPIVIEGPSVGVTINGDADGSVFYVEDKTATVHATFSGLTITGGHANSGGIGNEGGGILNFGVLTLSNCSVEGNYAHLGGGIFGGVQLTLDDCTISGNTAHGDGGGISGQSQLTALNSTISGNTAEYGFGGAIFFDDPEDSSEAITLTGCTISGNSSAEAALFSNNATTLTNCTISGNSSLDSVGGVYLGAYFKLEACTISANSAASGAGCGLTVSKNASGTRTLEDTIIAGNTSGSPASPSDLADSSDVSVTASFNLIGTGGSGGLANDSDGNIVLPGLAGLQLGSLTNNGGPTETMASLPGSLAINNGTAISGLTTDQRGDPLDRPTPDIGAYQSQGYSWSVIAESTPQSAHGGSSFSDPLAVMLTQNGTNSPVPGTTVTFTVTPGSNGASAFLSSTTAVSQANGVASVTATAYAVAGSFTVTATAGNLAPITFDLTVTVQPQPGFSNLTATTITYGSSSVELGGTIAAGSQIPSGENVAVTLDGVTQNAKVGGDGAFSTSFATSTFPASATPYTVSYAYDSDGNFQSASATSQLTVDQAVAQIVVTPDDVVYNGAAESATGRATGVGGVNLAADLNLSGTTHTNAGTYTDTWTFSDPSGNYQAASGTITDTIAKATATINVTPYSVTYDGTAHSATGTATGVLGERLAGLDLSHTDHTNPGTYTDTWIFTDSTGNYTDGTGTVIDAITVQPQPGFSNLTAPTITYGTSSVELGGTIAAGSQIPSGENVAVTLDGVTQNAKVGGDGAFSTSFATSTFPASATPYTVSYAYDSDGNFQSASATSQLTVGQAVAQIVVTPDDVVYNGAAESATGRATGVGGVSLAADLNLSGTTHTNAGTYADTWTFRDPSGNYQAASGTITDTIAKATATINVTRYSVTYDGTVHSATGMATGVLGERLVGLDLSHTDHTNPGTYTDTWIFTDSTGNYTDATGTVIDAISAGNGPVTTSPSGSTATTALVTGAGVSVYGQPAAVTVQVTANVPGAAVAAGTVELVVDGAIWSTGTLDSAGQTVISTAGITVGPHSIVAVYMGNASDGDSQSQPLAWRVNPAATSVSLTTSPVVNAKGKVTSVILIAQVEVDSPGTGLPTGSITLFRRKNHRVTSMNLNKGETSIRLTAKQVKGQNFYVDYSGSSEYSASMSTVLSGKSILSQRPGHAG